MNQERRFSFQPQAVATLQKRAVGDEVQFPNITGYGAVIYDPDDPGTQYDLFGDGEYLERIMPGAFDRALREDDVRGLFNHDPNMLLGQTSSGTMKLSVDRKGLRYEIDPPETQLGKQVTVSIERGDLTGSSFAFTIDEVVYREEQGGKVFIREITALHLYDVGPVTFPAYSASTTELKSRSLAGFEEWKRSKTPEAHSRLNLARRRLQILQQFNALRGV